VGGRLFWGRFLSCVGQSLRKVWVVGVLGVGRNYMMIELKESGTPVEG